MMCASLSFAPLNENKLKYKIENRKYAVDKERYIYTTYIIYKKTKIFD
tara:strand:+ start:397 stop:540 length:144 start_codon:yes stop_codon:yes gene_type:complete